MLCTVCGCFIPQGEGYYSDNYPFPVCYDCSKKEKQVEELDEAFYQLINAADTIRRTLQHEKEFTVRLQIEEALDEYDLDLLKETFYKVIVSPTIDGVVVSVRQGGEEIEIKTPSILKELVRS